MGQDLGTRSDARLGAVPSKILQEIWSLPFNKKVNVNLTISKKKMSIQIIQIFIKKI
jgi:hypothetical protein